jgi:hypothetical protein
MGPFSVQATDAGSRAVQARTNSVSPSADSKVPWKASQKCRSVPLESYALLMRVPRLPF